MREGLHLLRQRRIEHRTLPQEQFVDAPGQRGPMLLGQIEVAAQVKHGGLLDGIARSGAMHQAVGDIGLTRAAISGLGAANKHAQMLHEKSSARSKKQK